MTVIHVGTDSPYDVVLGRGLKHEVMAALTPEVQRIAILHAPVAVARNFAAEIAGEWNGQSLVIELADSEKAKTYEQLQTCWNALGEARFTRSDMIISIGGGATTDLAGYVAASWLRGVRVIHVPTTLLAMVDAAVGGKTGINTPAGKNLVGAFHHPSKVVCDFDFLAALPQVDLAAGFAEIVKCGFIADAQILSAVEQYGADLLDSSHPVFEEVVARAIAVKAEVVADDFKESKVGGLGREILNYGHTFGHAIELNEQFSIRHGEAISVGMMFVAQLAHEVGKLDSETVDLHQRLLSSLGLPTSYRGGNFEALLGAMSIDKKARGSQLRFVVLDALQRPAILTAPELTVLKAAFEKVCS